MVHDGKRDHRSAEAQAWRHLYKSKAWRTGRIAFLHQHPLCVMCKTDGRIAPATVVDHIEPHKGNEALFFDASNWQALCKPCHDSRKALQEARGYDPSIGEDGWPVDERHPANSRS